MFQRLLFWPLFAAIMGFALGGSIAWGIMYTPPTYHSADNQQSDQSSESKSLQGHEAKSLWVPEDATGFFTIWIAVFTGVLAISTIGLWIVTWQSSKRQSKDMTESIDIAERALVAGERAWIKVKIEVASNLSVGPSGIMLPLQFNVTNCGNSPATHVRVYHNLLLDHPGRMEIMEAYRRFSENVRIRAEKQPAVDFMSYTLFPDETKHIHSRSYVQAKSIDDAVGAWEKAVEERLPYFDLLMVGCIAYRIPFDDRQHQTGFSVSIKRRIDGTDDWGIFRLDETSVSPANIGIIESAWGSPSID